MSHEKIHALVDAYLAEHRRSGRGGGWAEITPVDMELLNKIIYKLITAKCDKDGDGDYPINFITVNRRIEYFAASPSLLVLPYKAGKEYISRLLSIIDALSNKIRYLLEQ
ncbi:MAG: hypothetical protein EHM32_02535 [Spirochaetales bacterium]|nr:MAG: hypothetical protein EHM32_02535 [Spirochaetales bacterium]